MLQCLLEIGSERIIFADKTVPLLGVTGRDGDAFLIEQIDDSRLCVRVKRVKKALGLRNNGLIILRNQSGHYERQARCHIWQITEFVYRRKQCSIQRCETPLGTVMQFCDVSLSSL